MDDPLELKQLAVKYDYLLYKIGDHIATLSEQTYQSVQKKTELVEKEYFQNQLDLDSHLANADSLLVQCDEIDLVFLKLDQLYMFVDDFKERVAALEQQMEALSGWTNDSKILTIGSFQILFCSTILEIEKTAKQNLMKTTKYRKDINKQNEMWKSTVSKEIFRRCWIEKCLFFNTARTSKCTYPIGYVQFVCWLGALSNWSVVYS